MARQETRVCGVCGVELDPELYPDWNHPECHPGDEAEDVETRLFRLLSRGAALMNYRRVLDYAEAAPLAPFLGFTPEREIIRRQAREREARALREIISQRMRALIDETQTLESQTGIRFMRLLPTEPETEA